MKRFCFSLLYALSAAHSLFGSEQVLQARLKQAKNGDYIVTEANKMISLLAIRSHTPHSLILEEISIPLTAHTSRITSWIDWVRQRAPGHTSWSMIEIDLQNYQVLECYSFSRSAWLQPSSQESMISILLGLPLKPLVPSERRRIGAPPPDGEADLRKIWQPPLVINGRRLDAEFDVYCADWPKDHSELSGHRVSLYFDRAGRIPFPSWIQIDTSHITASLRVIDSGHGLPSLHRSLPRRIPEFVGLPQKTTNGLRLSLKSPKYYQQFELFAIDITSKDKEICPMTYSLAGGDGELLQIDIDQKELTHTLKPDHRYTWLIVPIGYSESYTETPKPFLWKID